MPPSSQSPSHLHTQIPCVLHQSYQRFEMQPKVILILALLSLSLALESRQTHEYRSNRNLFTQRQSSPTPAAVGITVVVVLLIFGGAYFCCRGTNTEDNSNQLAPVIDQNNLNQNYQNAPGMNQPFAPSQPRYQPPFQPPFNQPMQGGFNNGNQPNPSFNQPRF